jgi:putative sterol carrier protein
MQGIAAILRDALAILERDAPVAALRLVREIAGLTLRFEVGDEVFALAGGERGLRFLAAEAAAADFNVHCDGATIMALIEGKTRVMDCVLGGALEIQGDVALMPALSRASVAFAEGAVRSRAMNSLLEEFRKHILRG